jgi:hypothetical protein
LSVFVDTGVLFAAAYAPDRRHVRAAELLSTLPEGERPFTSDHVLVEVWALLRSRGGWDGAMRFWHGLRHTPLVVEPIGVADLERAEAIAEDWRDQRFDIVDCTSFALMERVGCRRVASFDADFATYRYGVRRDRAFEVLR